jgi:sugar phosphate isomerase/epimerase
MPETGHPLEERFSVCEHVLRLGRLDLDLAATAAAGASAVSLNVSDFGPFSIADRRRLLDDSGLEVSSYIDPALMWLGPARPDLDRLEQAFLDAAALRSPTFLFIAGPLTDRSGPQADEQVLEALAAVTERTAGSGVRAMLEPLHPIARDLSYVHTVGHAVRLVRQVEGVGIVLDVGASWWEHDLVESVTANLDILLAVQITGVSADRLVERRYLRTRCSDEGDVPVEDLVRSLVAVGYDGWFEHEVLATASRDERIAMVGADQAWFRRLWT